MLNTSKVAKFGGTSTASLEQIKKVADIVSSDASIKCLVVSAPGRRYDGDSKITDLLIKGASEYMASGKSDSINQVSERIKELCPDDSLCSELSDDLASRLQDTQAENYIDLISAFGEYASAKIITLHLQKSGLEAIFADPKEIGFRLKKNRSIKPDSSCFYEIGKFLSRFNSKKIVIPGFYAYTQDGLLKTLPRGGSDTSGAVIANAVNASIYENWTNVDGLMRADPKIVPNASVIPALTFGEARELAYLGFKMHPDSFLPLLEKNIPLRIKNINNPKAEGTLIVNDRAVFQEEKITGVACKKGYIPIEMSKTGVNEETGFGRKILSALEDESVSFEHMLTGVDTLSLIIDRNQIDSAKLSRITRKIQENAGPLKIDVQNQIAIVAIAGLGIKYYKNSFFSRTFSSLQRNGIVPKLIDMGASDISLFIGVQEEEAEPAVRTIYREFFNSS